MNKKLSELTDEIFETAVQYRRELHKIPEIAYNEVKTSEFIRKTLSELGIEYRAGVAGTGVVGRINGKKGGRCIAVRADMDALNISEKTSLPFASCTAGKMHACGHDMHMAILLGTAAVLKRLEEDLPGDVVLIFQCAEESSGGAEQMIKEGAIDGVDTVIGGHVWPELPTGKVEIATGYITACPDTFSIKIHGKGGHAAYPQKAVNPILIGTRIIQALTEFSNNNDPLEPFLISITKFASGSVNNAIPDDAEILGTIRTINENSREARRSLMEEIIKGITVPYGATYEFDYNFLYPCVYNDPSLSEMFAKSAAEILNKDDIIFGGKATMIGEDFSYYSKVVPSVYIRIGCAKPGEPYYPLHNAHFSPDEECLKTAIKAYTKFIFDFLS